MTRTGFWSVVSFLGLFLSAGCTQQPKEDPAKEEPVAEIASFALPEAVSNNAVAVADSPEGATLYSFNGLKSGKTWQDTSNAAFSCVIKLNQCKAMPPVPVSEGRLASAAVTVAGKIYIFGGYTVAGNGDEVSSPELFAFDPATQSYAEKAAMPTPVDDMVAVPFQNRFIYLISGWHDEGNVSVVQLYDTQTDAWTEATPFPGIPVFGHAGGITGNTIIITDGVVVAPELVDGKRKFVASNLAWRGDIDPANPTRIKWRGIATHIGGPRYRMAAFGDGGRNLVVFAGGGDNPYNYDGIGYDGAPAKPTDRVFGYDVAADNWVELGQLARASMDHRALARSGEYFYILGGMDAEQNIISAIQKFRIPDTAR